MNREKPSMAKDDPHGHEIINSLFNYTDCLLNELSDTEYLKHQNTIQRLSYILGRAQGYFGLTQDLRQTGEK